MEVVSGSEPLPVDLECLMAHLSKLLRTTVMCPLGDNNISSKPFHKSISLAALMRLSVS